MGFLHEYFLNNPYKPIHKWLHYFDIYERHFERFRGLSPVMLEIGVGEGGSLEMWQAYFGPDSRIVGIDSNPECKAHESEGIEVFVGDQSDSVLIDAVFSEYPKIDIVVDDGNHIMKHMIASFKLIYERMQSDGVYLVEDTHTCYRGNYGGGLGREGSFMEFVKHKLDEINAAFIEPAVLPVSEFTRSTDCISCYDSVVVFERRRQSARQDIKTRGM